MDEHNLRYIIHHVILPPELPQEDDYSAVSNASLMASVHEALVEFRSYAPAVDHLQWKGCGKMIQNMRLIHSNSGGLLPEKLDAVLCNMAPGDSVALNIHGQNAGLVIRRLESLYLFESFELSPKNEEIIGTKGRLRRCFPGPAVAIDHTRILHANFREPLIKFLVALDTGTSQGVSAEVTKAQSIVREPRNTVDPRFVTEMLTGILRALGQPFDVSRVHKRTRDDVLWSDALNPWRRSPLWLLLRVALQTSLLDNGRSAGSHFRYKSFMIFFMTRLLERARECALPDELLFMMTAKITRRALKLEGMGESEWLDYTMSTVRSVQQDIASRWHALENCPDPHRTLSEWDATSLDLNEDTCLSLENLLPYLEKVESRRRLSTSREAFIGDCAHRILQSNTELPVMHLLHFPTMGDGRTFLADVELWVEDYLDEWMESNIEDEGTCAALKEMIDTYARSAITVYAGRPEDVSLMLLTLMELWVALDKCAVRHYPLLGDYDPGFPDELFDPLLLPQKSQMNRLFNIEEYLARRTANAFVDIPPIFGPISKFNSFAVRYFNQSPRHQELKREIELNAQRERCEKLSELSNMRQRQKQLVENSAKRDCEYTTQSNRKGREITSHNPRCKRCRLVSEAKKLSIEVHEWPLPERDLEAKAAVFELDVPIAISKWRDTTYGLLADVLSNRSDFQIAESSINKKVYTLRGDSGLDAYINPYIGRLQLASKEKPFTVSHYSNQKVSIADEESICVNNGMRYMLYDSKTRNWATDLLNDSDIRKKCTYKLESTRYGALQYAISNTTHTSNEVVSRQDKCPRTLTLHEFYAFGALRSGHRLQWRNIARELTAQILNFSHEEVHTLIIQSIWQVGPLNGVRNVRRDSHIDLEEEEFGMSLISAIDGSLRSVEGNWQAATAVRTFIVLTTRLLSLTPSDAVQLACLRVLRRAREITLNWTRELNQKLQEGQTDPVEMKNLNARTLEMALSCYGTFDVDQCHLFECIQSSDDVATVIECAIIIHDRRPPSIDSLSLSVKTLLQRHSRLSHSLERFLENEDMLSDGLDKTISRIWAGYRPGGPWTALPVPNDRWHETETSRETDCSPMIVQYNLLDGSLLVNGSPLARLPPTYEAHPTYLRLFSEKVIEVVPSTMDNMLFETRNEHFGQQVHFAMHGSELIIRTKQNGEVHELLPVHAMMSDFPQAFARDYAHWLDISTGLIEWRPLENPWVSSSLNWRMGPSGDQYILSHEYSSLIDVRSATANAVARVLSPLERATHIHVSLNHETGYLNVNLPRLKLDFFLQPGSLQLESKQFRGMAVDEDQSLGAFTGLSSKLVLRNTNASTRGVIVPHGDVSSKRRNQHVSVQVNILSAQQHVSHHFYQVDTGLGRLVDNGSLKSRLYKYYLHAMTTNCLVDKLTGKTGTEEALSGLKSASTQSFLRLESEEIDLLKLIAKLTPRRECYPSNLQVMQKISWNEGLPILAQHCEFARVVRSTIELAEIIHLFQDNPAALGASDIRINEHLLERAAIREAAFRVHGFGAEGHRRDLDSIYVSQDRFSTGTREIDTYSIAKKVDEWSVNLKICTKLLGDTESWHGDIFGIQRNGCLPLGYDISWLGEPSTVLPGTWCELQSTLSRSVEERDKYRILFLLCTMTYSQNWKQELVETLLAFATIPELRAIQPPSYTKFQLELGYSPGRSRLISIVDEYCRPFKDCPEARLPRHQGESYQEFADRHQEDFESEQSERVKTFVDGLINQWPHPRIGIPSGTDCNAYIKVDQAFAASRKLFQMWYCNYKFREYIAQIQAILNGLVPHTGSILEYSFSDPPENYRPKQGYVSFKHITKGQAPMIPLDCSEDFHVWVSQRREEGTDRNNVMALLTKLTSDSSSGYERQYANDLFASLGSLRSGESFDLNKTLDQIRVELELYLGRCRHVVLSADQQIQNHFRQRSSIAQRIAFEATMWPRLSPTSLLRHLSRDKIAALNENWRRALLGYGIGISAFQRAERLLGCIEKTPDLIIELQNPGHRSWDPMEHPDWVLLEVENNLLIRPVQAQVAQEMISPSSGKNSIMQLNMGEGKSSVIVPIVAAALANGEKMVRVVVLKPLSSQMFHLLVRKLGGMLNRRVFHIPISRSLKLSVEDATTIGGIYKECMRLGGILLVQPEHLLSFELMGFDRLLSGESELGKSVVGIQRWLDANSRDILDESDEILSVRFELIYTMGTQRAVEFSPDRWVIIEHVLGLVSRFAEKIQEFFPEGMEVSCLSRERFPRIRILHSDAGGKLMRMLARDVCDFGIPGIPVWNLPSHVRNILFKYLTDPSITEVEIQPLLETAFAVESMEKGLLLLKGLIAGGVLEFALRNKRWRVNYGLDLSRTMLAVPYRAKDLPAARAEFSHPDSTIVLTCLSYYYGGLSNSQLTESLERLLLSDHAQEEYDGWVRDAPELPDVYRQLTGVNLSDIEQCHQCIFPKLRFSKSAIDFYMSYIVFPKEIREFPHKLSSSGWDIARTKEYPTTGFSGTNDSRYILPLSIEQSELAQQQHTNAAQLACLLRPENTYHHIVSGSVNESLDAEKLLKVILESDPPVRVLLDVGAQVLELRNEEMAKLWLSRVPSSEVQAAIFFDDNNELMVLSKDGVKENLMVSPFAKQMDQCLVYLDEAHTRGTDLKLPTNYRAAVTLGPNLTKDRLVQACMRMRKLGKGQSVMFCGPMEVERSIIKCSGKPIGDRVDVADVLKWSIQETCVHTKKCIPLWATQGTRYQRRNIAWSDSENNTTENFFQHFAESLLEPEAQSLQMRYGLGRRSLEEDLLSGDGDRAFLQRRHQLDAIREKCLQFEIGSFNSASLQEEQERELSPENEREQQVERPAALDPQEHFISPDLEYFIEKGLFSRATDCIKPAFQVLNRTTLERSLEIAPWPKNLLATADFSRTVRGPPGQPLDMFLKPVHWIVSSRRRVAQFIIVSAFEANELLPSIREHEAVTLHAYSPRIAASMPSMEDLSLFAIPPVQDAWPTPVITIQLNLFAGQLYLRTYREYLALCSFLGLCSRAPDGSQVKVFSDGFVNPRDRAKFDKLVAERCRFTKSPVPFLKALMTLRRKGQNFHRSHLGAILNGELLSEEKF